MDGEIEHMDHLEDSDGVPSPLDFLTDPDKVTDPDADTLTTIDLNAKITCGSCGYESSVVSMKIKRTTKQIDISTTKEAIHAGKIKKVIVWHTFGRIHVHCLICGALVGVYLPKTQIHTVRLSSEGA